MSYIDQDGDTILETGSEIREFIESCTCSQCVMDAVEMLELIDNPRVTTHRIVFMTRCEHQ